LMMTGLALGDWDPSMPAKYVQMPDLNQGLDVNATYRQTSDGTIIYPFMKVLADDFPCTETGPITDIHVWGSWPNDRVNDGTTFKLSIHEDVPKSSTNPYSHPGIELWQQTFTPGKYVARPWATANEYFYEPNTNQIIGADTQVWQYNFFIPPTTAFIQQGTAANPKVYWLDVQAGVPGDEVFGWKTSLTHWNDDAVFADTTSFGGLPGPWSELIHPFTGQSLDLAFVITPEPTTILFLVGGLLGLLRRRT